MSNFLNIISDIAPVIDMGMKFQIVGPEQVILKFSNICSTKRDTHLSCVSSFMTASRDFRETCAIKFTIWNKVNLRSEHVSYNLHFINRHL